MVGIGRTLDLIFDEFGQKWHPDRCSASGNVKFVEEAKKKFQAIQEAYSGNFAHELHVFFIIL